MDTKTNILILLMIMGLFCISAGLVFADQNTMEESKATFTVQ